MAKAPSAVEPPQPSSGWGMEAGNQGVGSERVRKIAYEADIAVSGIVLASENSLDQS